MNGQLLIKDSYGFGSRTLCKQWPEQEVKNGYVNTDFKLHYVLILSSHNHAKWFKLR